MLWEYGVGGHLLLAVKYCNCIPVQKIVSLSTELTHSRSVLALDSDNGVCCHHSSS